MGEPYTCASMARDILSEIAFNALAPAPEGQSPLEERLKLLADALEYTRRRVEQQNGRMDQLRRDMAAYSALVTRIESASNEARRLVSLLPPPRQADAGPTAEPFSMPPNAVSVLAAAPAVRLPLTSFIPYAAIAALAAMLSVLASHRPARASLPAAAVPPPAAISLSLDRAATALQSEDENGTEVLSLVYSYVPPGSRRTVRDILGPELDSAANSPWTIIRVDARTTLVSFRPYSEALETAPAYEFSVDTVAKTVTPSDETVQNLRGNQIAAR
jgi:hypothetical protein